jgi:hypothetical protein
MNAAYTITPKQEHLYVDMHGFWTLEDMKAMAKATHTQAQELGCRRVLINALQATNSPDDEMRLDFALYLAYISMGIQIAFVTPAAPEHDTFILIANKFGVQLKRFTSERSAYKWLLPKTGVLPAKKPKGKR